MEWMRIIITLGATPALPENLPGGAQGSPPDPSPRPRGSRLGTSRLASLSRLLSAVSRANFSVAGLRLAPWRSATELGNRLHYSPPLQHSMFRRLGRKEISVQPRRQNVASPGGPPSPKPHQRGIGAPLTIVSSRFHSSTDTLPRSHPSRGETGMPLNPGIIKFVPGPATSLAAQPVSGGTSSRLAEIGGHPPKPASAGPARGSTGVTPSTRCAVRGCIFPAGAENPPRCLYHQRELTEPKMFETQQPSQLILGHAKFGLPDTEPDDSRLRARWKREKRRDRLTREEAA